MGNTRLCLLFPSSTNKLSINISNRNFKRKLLKMKNYPEPFFIEVGRNVDILYNETAENTKQGLFRKKNNAIEVKDFSTR